MDAVSRIEALIAPTLADMGYEIVRVRYGGKPAVLQIMAERASDGLMDIDDCEAVSRAVSAILDVEDPIEQAYSLEVSSPGIDRPLTRLKDFTRWAGHEAKVELKGSVEGRKRFRGLLFGAEGGTVRILVDGTEMSFAFADVADAKLILTDELIKAASGEQLQN